MFSVSGTKSEDAGKLTFLKNGGINFVGRTNDYNGVQGKIAVQNYPPNEPNTITASVIGNYKYAKFQQEPYYCSQNINKLTPKFKINRLNAIYFLAHIQKYISQYNGQQGGYKLNELKNNKILLPVSDGGEIDFAFMERFIKAVQKEVIKGVVEYAHAKERATKEAIKRQNA